MTIIIIVISYVLYLLSLFYWVIKGKGDEDLGSYYVYFMKFLEDTTLHQDVLLFCILMF